MLIQVILHEILAFLKFVVNTKPNVTFIGLLVVFFIFAINGNIVSNFIKERQAIAAANDLGTSLSDLIREKVSNIINKSLNQTLSGITQQSNSNSSTVNQQKSMQSSSISGPNKSTNVNCTNDKCIITTCADNNCTTTIQNSDKSAAGSVLSNITTITIGEPFYKQDDKPGNQKAVVVNRINASEISFSGTGITNGINFRDTGKALIMPRAGGATYIQGNVVITTNNSSEKASYSFQEIGESSSPDGTIKANGAAFFGSNATGKLAFLNNQVAIYHNQIDKAGNSALTAWKWK
jgi:hypothetical protein